MARGVTLISSQHQRDDLDENWYHSSDSDNETPETTSGEEEEEEVGGDGVGGSEVTRGSPKERLRVIMVGKAAVLRVNGKGKLC